MGFSTDRSPRSLFVQSRSFEPEDIAKKLRGICFDRSKARFSVGVLLGSAKRLDFMIGDSLILFNARLFTNLMEYMKPKLVGNPQKVYESLNFDRKLDIGFILRDCLFLLQSPNDEHILSLQTRLSIAYQKNLDPFLSDHSELHLGIAEGGFVRKTSTCFETVKTSIELYRSELFTYKKSDIFSPILEDYHVSKLEIKKRALTQPFDLNLTMRSLLCGCNRGLIKFITSLIISICLIIKANVGPSMRYH